jgi:hypothetical protein
MAAASLPKGEWTMKEGLTNAGKKEQRQINQILKKGLANERAGGKEPEARTVPKQHRLKHRKCK